MTIDTEKTARIQVAAGTAVTFPLDVPEGSYLRGRLHSPGHPFDLSLFGPDGAPVRLLLDDNAGVGRFHLIAGPPGQSLRARNDGPQDFKVALEIERIVPPVEQTGRPQTYLSPAMAALAAVLEQGGGSQEFWAERAAKGTPMIEPGNTPGHVIATFLWRGANRNVRLWGGPDSDHKWLKQLGESDVWFRSFEMPTDARLSYGFAPDVPQFDGSPRDNRVALLASLQADPLNKAPVFPDAPDRWAQRSMVVGPDAPVQPGMKGGDDMPAGMMTSGHLVAQGQPARRVDFYRPAGFDPAARDNVLLILFDGPAYQTARAPVPRILDRLIAQGRLPQVAVALIDPVDNQQRGVDLTCNPDFADRLALEWLPQIEAEFGFAADPARRAVAGSSYGGLASAYLVHRHPGVFGNAVVLSGSFWWAPKGHDGQGTPYMSSLWMRGAPQDVRLWMSAGIYEAGRKPGSVSILETTRHLRDVLTLKGVSDVTYREFSGGHDYLVWRGALAEGLLHLFGKGG